MEVIGKGETTVINGAEQDFNGHPVTKPNHYQIAGGKQLWDVMPEMGSAEEFLGYCKYNVLKYVCRYKKKNGIEDLKKAKAYIDRMIRELENIK